MSNEIMKTHGYTNVPATFNFFDPEQFEAMQRICRMFAYSELVPTIYRVKGIKQIPANASTEQAANIKANNAQAEAAAMANCLIAIETAMRIGVPVMAVMQNMTVIHGRPSWSSKFLIGTINSCGRYHTLKYRITNPGNVGIVDYVEYEWDNRQNRNVAINKQFDGRNLPELVCVAYTTEKGSDDILESPPVSLTMAIKEGWYTKSGSKWPTMPQLMLKYRAASMWVNTNAPELSMGMKTVEEIMDVEDVEFTEVYDTNTQTMPKKPEWPGAAPEPATATSEEPLTPTPPPAPEPAKTPRREPDATPKQEWPGDNPQVQATGRRAPGF